MQISPALFFVFDLPSKLRVVHIRKTFKIFIFLCELALILGVARKCKKQAEDIYKGAPDIELEQDGSVGLGAILADGQKIKNYFSSFRDFSGES